MLEGSSSREVVMRGGSWWVALGFVAAAGVVVGVARLVTGQGGVFVASEGGTAFHRRGCRFAKPGDSVLFDSREQAEQAGYRPCKVCGA